MNTELLPCPFETVEKDFEHSLGVGSSADSHYLPRVGCQCGARGPVMGTDDQSAIDGWNTRAPITLEQAKRVIEKAGMVCVPSSDHAERIAVKMNEIIRDFMRAIEAAQESE